MGEGFDGEPLPDAVAAFAEDMRDALVESPDRETAAGHLRAIALARVEPVADPGRRPWPVVARLRPHAAMALAAAALAICSTVGVLGALPAPVQAALADASRAVGVEVVPRPEPPRPSQRRAAEPRTTSRPAAPSHPPRGAAGGAPADDPPAAARSEATERPTVESPAPASQDASPRTPPAPAEVAPSDPWPDEELSATDDREEALGDEPVAPGGDEPSYEEEP